MNVVVFIVARRGFSSYHDDRSFFYHSHPFNVVVIPRTSSAKKKKKTSTTAVSSCQQFGMDQFLLFGPFGYSIEIGSSSEKSHPSVGYVNIFPSGEFTINPSIHPFFSLSHNIFFCFFLSLLLTLYRPVRAELLAAVGSMKPRSS